MGIEISKGNVKRIRKIGQGRRGGRKRKGDGGFRR
jgi:hypothetical protein